MDNTVTRKIAHYLGRIDLKTELLSYFMTKIADFLTRLRCSCDEHFHNFSGYFFLEMMKDEKMNTRKWAILRVVSILRAQSLNFCRTIP